MTILVHGGGGGERKENHYLLYLPIIDTGRQIFLQVLNFVLLYVVFCFVLGAMYNNRAEGSPSLNHIQLAQRKLCEI